jgi:hypothetical protein
LTKFSWFGSFIKILLFVGKATDPAHLWYALEGGFLVNLLEYIFMFAPHSTHTHIIIMHFNAVYIYIFRRTWKSPQYKLWASRLAGTADCVYRTSCSSGQSGQETVLR